MKSNDSLFRKAYNNHHDANGTDVSSTADNLMRNDIGDGVFLDGENFSYANGDDRPNDLSDPIPLGGIDGGNPNWEQSINHDLTIYRSFENENFPTLQWADGNFSALQPKPGGHGNCLPAGTGEMAWHNFDRDEIMIQLGAPLETNSQGQILPSSETPINQWFKFRATACYDTYGTNNPQDRPLARWGNQIYVKIISGVNFYNFNMFFKVGFFVAIDDGYFFDNIDEMITAYQQFNPNTQGAVSSSVIIEPIYVGDGDNSQPVRSIQQLYAYVNDAGDTESGPTNNMQTCGDVIGILQGYNSRNILGLTPPAPPQNLQPNYETGPYAYNVPNPITNYMNALYDGDFGAYIYAILYGILCSAGYRIGIDGDEQQWLVDNNCPLSTNLVGNQGTNPNASTAEAAYDVYEDGGGIDTSGDDGGIATPNGEVQVSYLDEIPNSSKNFSNANGNYVNDDNVALITALNKVRNFIATHPITLGMHTAYKGVQDEMYPQQIGENVNKQIYDYVKVADIMEVFIEMVIMMGDCVPTGVKNAMQDIVLESIARNTKFLDIETDYVTEMLDSLNISHPPNIFTEYTSLEYNELANSLANSQGQITALQESIDYINQQYQQVVNELTSALNMMEYEQDATQDLQAEIEMLLMEKAQLQAELMAFMMDLQTMETEFIDVISENAYLQADLGASSVLINNLQADLAQAEESENILANMIDNLQAQLTSSDTQLAGLQAELSTVIGNLNMQIAEGQSLQAVLQTQLDDSTSQINNLLTQIVGLEAQLAISQGQIDDNTLNQQDVAYYENQISVLNQANQSLLLTIQEMEMQTGQTATDLSSGGAEIQGKIDLKTGRGTIQLLKSRPKTPQKLRQAGKKLSFA